MNIVSINLRILNQIINLIFTSKTHCHGVVGGYQGFVIWLKYTFVRCKKYF